MTPTIVVAFVPIILGLLLIRYSKRAGEWNKVHLPWGDDVIAVTTRLFCIAIGCGWIAIGLLGILAALGIIKVGTRLW